MRRTLWSLLVVTGCAGHPATVDVRDATCFADLVTLLSTDAMEGRGIGTEGLERAALALEHRLRAAGLGDGGMEFRQTFSATTGVRLGDENTLSVGGEALVLETDFVPLGFSSDGAFDGPLVFAGYGIVAEEPSYDDYAGLDVNGKVVLAMRYEPGETDEASPFNGKKPSRFSDVRYKAMRARELGASALLLVSPARGDDEPDKLPPLRRAGPSSRAGLPVVQVTRAVADRLLARAGTDLDTQHEKIDATYAPASVALDGDAVAGHAEVVPTQKDVRNVLGVLPGSGALADETVVIGAHYDHLGHGGAGSMRPDSNEIHNGADDNASGTAAMICALEALAADPPAGDRRTVLGIAFAAEEIGLGGSAWYADHPLFPHENTTAMINLDMVGRVRDGTLQALGGDTAPEWEEVFAGPAEAAGLTVDLGGDGYGPSDHTSFYEKRVPVVHLFSGTHEEYHTPDDDLETLNLTGGTQVMSLLDGVVRALAVRPDKLTYVRSESGSTLQGDSRGYNAYLGTIPDFSAMSSDVGGVLLTDVRDEGPAHRAGIQGGDIIVGMAGAEIQNLYDMTFVLRDHKPGETIEVVVQRGEEELSLKATLGTRGKMPSATPAPDNPTEHGDFSVGASHPAGGDWAPTAGKPVPELLHESETHLAGLRQLTFGGENAEAYWGPGGRRLVFQRTPVPGEGCDQEYVLDLTSGAASMVSTGKGRTTCGYFDYPDAERVIYATTEEAGEDCPPTPDHSNGYVWPIYDSFDLVWRTGKGEPQTWLSSPKYDAEATVCMADGRVVFTSTRDGDLDLYIANGDGTGLERITDTAGYDGGAFFNPGCDSLIWRASRPTGEALVEYQGLLAEGLVRPSELEIFWMDLETRTIEQLTDNGAANFAPYPMPDDSGVLFSSNVGGSGREFDIYRVSRGGGETEQITHTDGFDGFPMFSPDGRWIAFSSNRASAAGARDTNVFVARWVD